MPLEVTGPSVVRPAAVDPEDEPQWRTLIAHAGVSSGLVLPQTGCDRFQPFRYCGSFSLWPVGRSLKQSPRGPGTDVEGGD